MRGVESLPAAVKHAGSKVILIFDCLAKGITKTSFLLSLLRLADSRSSRSIDSSTNSQEPSRSKAKQSKCNDYISKEESIPTCWMGSQCRELTDPSSRIERVEYGGR